MPTIEVPPDLTPQRLQTLVRFARMFDPDSKVSKGITGEIGTFIDAHADLETAKARGDVKEQRKAQRQLRRLENPTAVQKFLKQAVPGTAMVFFGALIPVSAFEFYNTWQAAGANFGEIAKNVGDIGTTFLHFNILNPGSTIQRIANDYNAIQTTLLTTLPSRANELLRDATEFVGGILGAGLAGFTQPWKAPRKRGRFPI